MQTLSGNSTWTAQHAALMSIAMLCDGAAEHFGEQLPAIMQIVVPLGESTQQNARVLYAVLTCYSLLVCEFAPEIYE
jgi:hypothetical protein